MTQPRIRNTGYQQIAVADLLPYERNPWQHDTRQRELFQSEMDKRGFAGALIVRPHPAIKGKYQIIDGHMRSELMPNAVLPCIITDYTDDEVKGLSGTGSDGVVGWHNLLAQMSTTLDTGLLATLKSAGNIQMPDVSQLLSNVNGERIAPDGSTVKADQAVDATVAKPKPPKSINPEPPAAVQWVLLGIKPEHWTKAHEHLVALEALSCISVQKSGGESVVS